jgi:MarR family transcriptional regulator for hemolysin
VLDQRLAQQGFSDISWVSLIHLDESGGGLTQKELAERVGIDGSSLVRLVDRLEERGHLERRSDGTDRRAKRLFLTESGLQAAAELRQTVLAVERELLRDLGDDELEVILAALGRLQTRLTGGGSS